MDYLTSFFYSTPKEDGKPPSSGKPNEDKESVTLDEVEDIEEKSVIRDVSSTVCETDITEKSSIKEYEHDQVILPCVRPVIEYLNLTIFFSEKDINDEAEDFFYDFTNKKFTELVYDDGDIVDNFSVHFSGDEEKLSTAYSIENNDDRCLFYGYMFAYVDMASDNPNFSTINFMNVDGEKYLVCLYYTIDEIDGCKVINKEMLIAPSIGELVMGLSYETITKIYSYYYYYGLGEMDNGNTVTPMITNINENNSNNTIVPDDMDRFSEIRHNIENSIETVEALIEHVNNTPTENVETLLEHVNNTPTENVEEIYSNDYY